MKIWDAAPADALWLGEIVYGTTGVDDWNYACGWSASIECPDLATLEELIPHGIEIQQSWISVLPRHPDYYRKMKG